MDLSGHEEEIPIPINSSTYVGQSHGHGHSLLHDHSTPTPLSLHHHHHHHPHPNPPSTNGPPPPPPPPLSLPLSNPVINEEQQHSKKGGAVVKYRECLKNHAASIGGNATDGCGEFMPSGEEGTLEALKCSACNCHRNFHRKEVEGECDYFNNNNLHHHHHIKLLGGGRKLIGGHKGVLISSSSPDAAAAAAFGYNSNSNNNNSLIPRPTPHNMIMPLGAMQTSESDEMEGTAGYPRPPMMKKRFRTKFSAEQKEKMLAFAEKAGWRLQKQEESVVQHFCQEIGVKRRVLKVWMHNNKHNFAKKNPLLPSTLDDNRINEMN